MITSTSPATKPGVKTSEFWLSAVATLLSMAVAVSPKVAGVTQTVGVIGGALIPLGYAALRTFGKTQAATALATFGQLLAQVSEDAAARAASAPSDPVHAGAAILTAEQIAAFHARGSLS